MEQLLQPWPWYVGGPLIALVLLLLLLGGKTFGMSANLRTLCTICGADKTAVFFKINWKDQNWNLMVALGAVIGGFIAANWLSTDSAVAISSQTIEKL